MNRKFFNALQVLNMLFQALYTLALPICIGALAAFLLTKYASAPGWIWAVLILLGVLLGLYSMVKLILAMSAGMERAERQREEVIRLRREKEERQERLRAESKTKENKGENEKSE